MGNGNVMTFVHWHELQKELSTESKVTDNPDDVTCEACNRFLEKKNED
jgi:hypothetical protein